VTVERISARVDHPVITSSGAKSIPLPMASHAPGARVLRGAFRYSPLRRHRGLAGGRDRDRLATLPSPVASPAALMGFAPFAGLLPQAGGSRVSALAGPTCRWLHATSQLLSATVFVAADRAALDLSEQMSVKGGGVERSAIRDASASGLQSRLRSAAAGMKPSAAILPWAFGSSFRFAGRTSACARARQFAPSRRHQPPRPLPRPPSAHGFRRRSFPRFAMTFIGV
jgi:hypothetical protein